MRLPQQPGSFSPSDQPKSRPTNKSDLSRARMHSRRKTSHFPVAHATARQVRAERAPRSLFGRCASSVSDRRTATSALASLERSCLSIPRAGPSPLFTSASLFLFCVSVSASKKAKESSRMHASPRAARLLLARPLTPAPSLEARGEERDLLGPAAADKA